MADLPYPPLLVAPFAVNGDRNVIPATPGVTPGRASLDLGFPPATMVPTTAGGVPPSGKDFNGILYSTSAIAAWLAAGRSFKFSSTLSAALGGYQPGAIVQSASDATLFFMCLTASNGNDPDVTPTGWAAWRPTGGKYLSATVPAGINSDFNPTGWGTWIGTLDLDPSSGNSELQGLVAGYDGQVVTVSNINATNLLQLTKLAGPTPANQFRCATDLTLLPGGAAQVKYVANVSKWILIP